MKTGDILCFHVLNDIMKNIKFECLDTDGLLPFPLTLY